MKKVFLIGILTFFLFIEGTSALTIETKEGKYVLEEIKTKCDISKMWVFGMNEENELVLEDNVTGDLVKLTKDKECQKLTPQQILDFNNYIEKKMNTEYFYEEKSNGDIVIMKKENAMFFEAHTLTEDTVVDLSKTYYHDNDSNNIFEEVVSPIDSEIGTYYEKIFLKNPTTTDLTEGPYYQYVTGGAGVEKVISPNVDDIKFYFILTTDFSSKISEVTKLDKSIFKPLLDANSGKVSVTENNGEIYIAIENDSQYPKFLADYYTLDGKKIADDVSVAFKLNQSLVVKYDHDLNVTNIYDSQDKLVHEFDGLLWEYLYKDSVSYLFTEKNGTKIYELSYYEKLDGIDSTKEVNKTQINNPQTFDGITFYISLFFVSLMGCLFTTFHLKNKIRVTK